MPRVTYRNMYSEREREAIVDYLGRMRESADKGLKSCLEAYRVSKQDWCKRNADYYRNVRAGFDFALHWVTKEEGQRGKRTEAVQDRAESEEQDRSAAAGRRDMPSDGGGGRPRSVTIDDPSWLAIDLPANQIPEWGVSEAGGGVTLESDRT